MSDAANRIVQKLWSYCNVLRDDGLSYQDYLEQLTFLLFLKMADERERLTGEGQPIPAGYRWENLASPTMEGAELDQHYRETLRVLGTRGGMLGLIFEKAQEPDPDGQIVMRFSEARVRQRRSRWLGLATDHRRLFGALADGWLRPLQSRAGVLIGVGAYAVEPSDAPGGHPIAVRIRLDAAKLPAVAVSVRRGERWVSSRLGEFEATDAALYWPGALPAFAFSGISVSTKEERRRLEGLARSVSNVDLAATALGVDADAEGTVEPDALPEVSRTFVIPDDEDAIHGP